MEWTTIPTNFFCEVTSIQFTYIAPIHIMSFRDNLQNKLYLNFKNNALKQMNVHFYFKKVKTTL